MYASKYDYFSQIMQQEDSSMPTLLYITKQNFGGQKHDRPMHSHDKLCELLLVYKGYGSYAIRDQSFPIQEGDVLYYNQDDSHEVRSISDSEIGTYCFGLQNVKFKELPPNHMISSDSAPVRTSGALFPFLQKLCEQAYLLLDAEDIYAKATAQSLASTFLLLARRLEEQPLSHSLSEQDTKFSQRIMAYLDSHYTEEITLKAIADYFKCSEPYVSHVFKKATGYSPIQYVIRRRIGLAQTHLISSDYTATQIASLVGYDNSNYFNTIFTRIVGISPIRYRKKYLDGASGNVAQ